jgi:hypothetical protein
MAQPSWSNRCRPDMLRSAAVLISAILVITLISGSTLNGWPTLPFAVIPGIVLLGLLVERFAYKPIRTDIPGPGWERTAEQFTDPKSGRAVVVWYNPTSGERRYVASPEASP